MFEKLNFKQWKIEKFEKFKNSEKFQKYTILNVVIS